MNIKTQTDSHLYALQSLGLLKVSGTDAEKLLQGQLTCDVSAVTPTNGVMGAHCNPQGRIISLFYLMQIASDYYLVMPQSLIPIALAALKKYAVFYRVELSEASNNLFIAGSTGKTWPEDAAIYTIPHSHRSILLLAQAPTDVNQDEATWHDLNIHEGIPSLYPETSGTFLPHDLGLPQQNAVSFSKGCFTGQEIIARMQYRGKPKNHLYRGLTATPLKPGTSLYSQANAVGTVIDCCKKMYNNLYPFLFVTDEASLNANKLKTEQGQLIEIQQSESPWLNP